MTFEPYLRLGCFFGVLVIMAIWEIAAPRRRLLTSKPVRWFSNLGLVVIDVIAVRLAFALGAMGVALEAQRQQWGLFNNVTLAGWLEVVLAVVLLDLAIYLQHVLFHAVPMLWRLHMVHHADPDFDVTTGLRFHVMEIALSLGIKIAAIVLLGVSPLAVLIFEVLLNATSMFNHSNVRIPVWLDSIIRLFVVTPDMHRVHHSQSPSETNSNFGFSLSWWDYLLGTYRSQPATGHQEMAIGLKQTDPRRAIRLHWMLAMPFQSSGSGYSINRSRETSDEARPESNC